MENQTRRLTVPAAKQAGDGGARWAGLASVVWPL